MWDDWRAYAYAADRPAGSPAEFAAYLEARGFVVDRLPGEPRRIRWGIRLRSGAAT